MSRPRPVAFSVYLLFAAALTLAWLALPRGGRASSTIHPDEAAEARAGEAYGKLPISFVANEGQADERVKFISRGGGYSLSLTPTEAVLVLAGGRAADAADDNDSSREAGPAAAHVLVMRTAGANPSPRLTGLDELPGKVNYLLGSDPARWRTNVPTYSRVKYEGVYDGVDLVYYGNPRKLEYDFLVAPGADPRVIRLAFEGMDGFALNERGDLVLRTAGGELSLNRPVAYQEAGGRRVPVESRYVIKGAREVGFEVGDYDHDSPLVIDPVLVYSTYLGGNNLDQGFAIAVNSAGNAFVTGNTYSANFPVLAGSLQPALKGSSDVFVTKLNAAGSAVVYSTFIGGTGVDQGFGIAVNAAGQAHVTGSTTSTDFPVVNALRPAHGGVSDAFVAKLNAAGSSLVYSTYLGGASYDDGNAIALDAGGNVYVTGDTNSRDFPTANPFQADKKGTGLFRTADGGASWQPGETGLGGANITDIVFDPKNSSVLYAATEAGVYKSADAGNTWAAAGVGQIPRPVNRLAVNPVNTSVLYATTDGGVYKSTNGGSNWAATGLTGNISTRAIVINPSAPNTLYVAPYPGDIVHKSTDGGVSWSQTPLNSSSFLILNLAIDASAPSNVYAGTSRGLFKSTNGGSTWGELNLGFYFAPAIDALALDKKSPATVYASTYEGVLKSTNGGTSWVNLNPYWPGPRFTILALDPSNSSTLYGAMRYGPIYKSTDGGANWTPIENNPLAGLNVILVDPAVSAKIYLGGIGGAEAFVTKLNAAGSSLVYSTYLGGGGHEAGKGIAVGADGSAHVAGLTGSSDFPVANALQPAKGDNITAGTDAFITKLSPAGNALTYSTYLGGGNYDSAHGVALDGSGNAYVVGWAGSADFPTTAGAFQTTHSGVEGYYDTFVTKVNPAGSALVYSTFVGGEASDYGYSIAVNSAGAAFVAGVTDSPNFPTTGAAYGPLGYPPNAFVTQLSPAGSSLAYSLLVGGTYGDVARAVALDSTGGVYVAGYTDSQDFPTLSAKQAASGGDADAFVLKLRPAADLAVTMTDSPDPAALGKNLTYTITVQNAGDLPATNVTLQDTLPSGATFVSVTTSRGTCSGTSAVTCNLGDMAPGASAVVKLVIKPPAVKNLSNTASAACAEAESTLANNSATQTTEVSFAALSIVKQAVYDQVAPGSKVVYFITVTNSDGTTASNVVVSDILPADVTFSSCKAAGGTCGGAGNNRTVTFPSLAVGQSARAVIVATVKPTAAQGTVISNTATVRSATADSSADDNSSTAKATVNTTPIRRRANGKIAYGSDRAFSGSTEPTGIYTVSANGTGDALLIDEDPFASPPAWSPDGTRIAYGKRVSGEDDEIYVARADGTNPVMVADNVSGNNSRIAWSPNGAMLAYVGAGDFFIHVVNADGTGRTQLPNSPQYVNDLSWSPDGSKFAYSDGANVFVMNVDGSGRTNLTNGRPESSGGSTLSTRPRWSPDGKRILFQATSANFDDAYVMNADGTALTRLLNVPRSEDAAWSPDGTRVVFVTMNELYVSKVDGTGLVQVTKNGFYNYKPDWQAQPGITPAPPPDTTPVKTYTIKGHVNVGTELKLTGTRTGSRYTDQDGNYEFVNLPEGGNYTVTPTDPRYSFSPAKRTFAALSADQTGADFTGTFVPANISGHVRDAAGNPMPNVRVLSQGGFFGSTTTDANGYYIFPNLPRYRSYMIYVHWSGPYGYTPASFTFDDLQRSQTADFVGARQPSHVIAGRVTRNDAPDVGVAGVTVGMSGAPNFDISVTTDANGYFTFGEQKDGYDYWVYANDWSGAGYIYSPGTIKVSKLSANQQLKFVRYPATGSADITGKVADARGQAVGGVTLTLTGGWNRAELNGENGLYEINNVPTGLNYTLRPSKPGYYFIPSSLAINNLTASGKVANFTASRTGLQFSAANYSVQEGAGAAVVSVKRVGDTAGTVSVKYATSNGTAAAGSDYTAAAGTVTFAPGETVKTFSVPVTDDSTDEANETIKLSLSAPAGGAGLGSVTSATVTVADNDLPPTVSINNVTVTEPGAGQTAAASFTVTLSAASGQNVSVKYASANGTAAAPADYTARALTLLTFTPGQTSKSATVIVKGDTTTEPDETFKVLLSSPVNATVGTGQGTGTIKDAASAAANSTEAAPSVEFAEAAYSASEDDGRLEVTVRRSGDLSAPLEVSYETADATATERSDYGTAAGRLSFAPGEESKSLALIITDDSYAEGEESLRLTLSLPEGGAALGQNSEAEVTLADNDRVDGAVNPLDDSHFFVRQQFVDLLGREPEADESAALVRKLNECPAGDATCGREAVTAGLLLSDEYQSRARLVYGLYTIALGREPSYREFVREMRSVSDADELRLYTEQWLRAQGVKTDNKLISSLRTGEPTLKGKTRAELLMSVIGRDEVREKLRAESLVLIHYFTFLRRDPEDEGRRAWAAAAGDVLNLVSGFINSSEYRQRFGQ